MKRFNHYTVTCDLCHGQLFKNGILCPKCDGDGRILVADTEERLTIKRAFSDAATALRVARERIAGMLR